MNALSAAYIMIFVGDRTYTYHFTGVKSVDHSLSLNLENTAAEGADIVNGARNLPDQVTLNVIETDAEHYVGWSSQMLSVMKNVKENRYLSQVVTNMATYYDMLLAEITASEDEENQHGWSGSLTFVQYVPAAIANAAGTKTNNNSSTPVNTGTSGIRKALTPFQQMISAAVSS